MQGRTGPFFYAFHWQLPVHLHLLQTTSQGYFQINGSGSATWEIFNSTNSTFQSATIASSSNPSTAVDWPPCNCGEAMDFVTAGTWTWVLFNTNGAVNNSWTNIRLIAYEL